MATPSRTAPKQEPSEPVCASCGHLESQHGNTGTRPCLAMTGDLVSREFCTCDCLSAKLHKAA